MIHATDPRLAKPRLLLCAAALATLPVALAPARAGAQAPIPLLRDMSASASTLRDSIVDFARAQVGRRYKYGGTTPERGFDCSGLVQYILAMFQTKLPRTARYQAEVGVPIDRDTSLLRPGDLLTFSRGERGRVSHIGIYVGGGRFIHASSFAGRVIESPLNRPPAKEIKLWRGARRVPLLADNAAFAESPDVIRAPER